MSNSNLIVHTHISPNSTNPRNSQISKLTIHHMAGNLTIESCGNWFAQSSTQASSNYGIGSDGRVGLYVDEKNRSWCSSSPDNDNKAVTIEVANSDGSPNWPVSDKAYNSLIELCVDICKRNNIKELKFDGTSNANLTTHDMFREKLCPGPYLKAKMPEIARLVNAKLGNNNNLPVEQYGLVKIDSDTLNIRSGPGTNYAIVDVIKDKGNYTILDCKQGQGSNKGWGWLKSGAGWISLDFVQRI